MIFKMNILYIYVIYAGVFFSFLPVLVDNSENKTKSPFLAPIESSKMEDVFVRGLRQYIFVNYPASHSRSRMLCANSYNARLAFVQTTDIAEFLAEALSETNLFMDAVWVGAKETDEKQWFWFGEDGPASPVDEAILKLFVNYSQGIKGIGRWCLAMGRKNHDIPFFPHWNCSVQRPFLCERKRGDNSNDSTHPNWIPVGANLYKIFEEPVTWAAAEAKCILYDDDAHLAVVPDMVSIETLGRYLLIGRPSLENAWIGASYRNNQYIFEEEAIILSNTSNADGYPPWRDKVIQKPSGCILLDRHLSNISLFVEVRCQRLRPYICYKKRVDEIPFDIIFEKYGYRIFPNMVAWFDARQTCYRFPLKYEAKLVEIREKIIISHLLYAMGENKTVMSHLWLGGTFSRKGRKWIWDSDKSMVDTTILNWLKNNTYEHSVDDANTCLNMDRENHLAAIHYGTLCDYPQSFACMFLSARDKLIELQKDEAQNKTHHS